jgi:serine/threonine-protein kinase
VETDEIEQAEERRRRTIGDRYLLEDRIGEGGMGEVWRARHLALRSMVAIKLLHGNFGSGERARQRFLTEDRLTSSLKSRHAVQVFDYGVTAQGVPYVVMELLEGETLDQRLARRGPMTPDETLYFLRQAARALNRAHALGIVHRDFKPQNLIICTNDDPRGEVKVLDFGIAKLVGDLEHPADAQHDAFDLAPSSLSRSGHAIGTPYYMAPEQILSAPDVGPAADIWALGVVSYECLTGRRPFQAESVTGVFQRVLQNDYVPAHEVRGELPEATEAWFGVALAPKPGQRFSDAAVAVEALAEALGEPALSSPTSTGGGRFSSPDFDAMSETLEAAYDLPVLPRKRRVSAIDVIAILSVVIAFGAAMAVALLER